ncbi:MAG: hypothetical protein IJF32_10455 [Oscillospiraceae bacterium]|nr:hypothetical protein [Oscillospiraceae bacterium]
MKNVFLIGDSIRFGAGTVSPGYGIYVKEMLDGKANVYYPNENCRFAEYTLRALYDWAKRLKKEDIKIDLIHWNNGLWDVLRLNGDEPLTPCDIYVYYLRRIHAMLRKLFPEAKIIFALSTSILEEKASPDFCRFNADIERYNGAARALMDELGVTVNDLYTVSNGIDASLHCDWVHFGKEGSEILAKAVTEAILKELN